MPFSLGLLCFSVIAWEDRNGFMQAVVMQTVHGVPATNCSRKRPQDLPGPAACAGKLSVYVMITSSPVRRCFQNLAVTWSPEIMFRVGTHWGVAARDISARSREFGWSQS